MQISELNAKSGFDELIVEIIEKQEARTFNKFGKEGQVANAKGKDESGEVSLTLWNEQVDQVGLGDKIKITNGWVGEWQGDLQVSTGKFGKLEIIEKANISENLADDEIALAENLGSEEDLSNYKI